MKLEAATRGRRGWTCEKASKDKRRKFWKLYRRKSLIIASPISSIIFARRRTKEIAAMCSVFFRGRLIACCFERRAVLARSLLLLFGTEKREKTWSLLLRIASGSLEPYVRAKWRWDEEEAGSISVPKCTRSSARERREPCWTAMGC